MSAIGKGDWVECLRCNPGGIFSVGSIHQVLEVLPPGEVAKCQACHKDDFAIRVPGTKGWWAGCCFRPIYRPSSDFIESLKRPAPADKEVA